MRSPLNKPHRITSLFGQRILGNKPDYHYGLDLVPLDNKHPTELFSTADGIVTDLRSTVSDSHTGLSVTTMVTGNYVNIKTQDNHIVIYRHLKSNSICVKLNQTIKTGDRVGIMGLTGQSSGVHLHYELRSPNGIALNPALYLDNDKMLGGISVNQSFPDEPLSPFNVGDKVKVLNAVTYTGNPFRLYFPEYDIIQINNDRIVIGVGTVVTAPIHIDNIQKV